MASYYIGIEMPVPESPTETLKKMAGWGMMMFHQIENTMWVEWIFPRKNLGEFCEIMGIEGVDEIKVYTFS